MRYAVVADLHGKRKAWGRVCGDAERQGVDRFVCLGDYLEAKVPWRDHDRSKRWDLAEVVDRKPRLWKELAGADLVLGNQEWRIRDLLRPDQVAGDLVDLLAAPECGVYGAAMAMHGHQFNWEKLPRDAGWTAAICPRLAELPDVPILFVGHSHQVMLLEIVRARRLLVTPGRPIPLASAVDSGRRLLVNVGPACTKPSCWVLYDDSALEVTFHEVEADG